MDINGTRFHLFKDSRDWARCRLAGQPPEVGDWYAYSLVDADPDWLHVAWDASSGLTLSSQLAFFPRGRRDVPLDPGSRRGAAVDGFGNWYWISHDALRIYWAPSGTGRPSVFWEQSRQPARQQGSSFGPSTASSVTPCTLGGLAVTAHHYLVAGNLDEPGLLIFDLHAGGEPALVNLPDETLFEPFDMAAAADGGVWVLDRTNRTYWRFDRSFQVAGRPLQLAPDGSAGDFQPSGGKSTPAEPGSVALHETSPPREPAIYTLPELSDPISIETAGNDEVLILDNVPGGPSVVHHYAGALSLADLPLQDDIEVVTLDETSAQEHLAVIAHDVVYSEHDRILYAVERDGNQAIAFRLDLTASPPRFQLETVYLPMHNHGARALVGGKYGVFYDLIGRDPANDRVVRWMPLQAIDQQRYRRSATVDTPVLDGRTRDCIWHRIFVDGCIPPESEVELWTRAHNDPDLVTTVAFRREPVLYLRSRGPEIAWHQVFTEEQIETGNVGTWEVLCQQMHGRYGQMRLVLRGNGRVTPQIQALRSYYPRFSYPRNYLPGVYLQEPTSADFLERLLANMEGTYSELEGAIRSVYTLFDGRSAAPATLDWLAGWLGLVVDPIWATIQQHRLEEAVSGVAYGDGDAPGRMPDRRRLFIRFARQLYERRGTPDGIKFALHLLLEPCLEGLLDRFQRAAVRPDPALSAEFALYGLTPPTPTTSAQGFEELLHDYLLAPQRPSPLRLVERFMTRNGRAMAAGDPSRGGGSAGARSDSLPITPALIEADAHRFAVLLPERLTSEEAAMVRRIVNLEKPAHTHFEVRRYWDYYRVGEARMGLDTILGESGRFTPVIVGRAYLAEGYLASAHPLDAKERFVLDRDRLNTTSCAN